MLHLFVSINFLVAPVKVKKKVAIYRKLLSSKFKLSPQIKVIEKNTIEFKNIKSHGPRFESRKTPQFKNTPGTTVEAQLDSSLSKGKHIFEVTDYYIF